MNRGSRLSGGVVSALVLALLAATFGVASPGCAGTAQGDGGGDRAPTVKRAETDGPSIRKPTSDRPRLTRVKPGAGRVARRTPGTGTTEPKAGALAAKDRTIKDQQERISQLQKDLEAKEGEVTSLKDQLAFAEGSGSEEVAERLKNLTEERDRLSQQLEDDRASHEKVVKELRDQINTMSGGEGGPVDTAKLIQERNEAVQNYEDVKIELDAVKSVRGLMEKQLEELSKEKSGWDEKEAALVKARTDAEQSLTSAQEETARLSSENENLTSEVEKFRTAAEDAEKRATQAETLEKKDLGEVKTALKKVDEEVRGEAKKAKTAGLIGLILALAAVGLGVFLFLIIRNLRYEVAVAQAQSGGGIDPAEVEQIVSAQMSELAGSLPTMGAGGDIEEVVGENIKKVLSTEIQSEAFQNQVKELVAQSGGAPGKGGGGGGLSPQDVKIMVDNQFRAITTYLKNEAVPKMVEDAIKKQST